MSNLSTHVRQEKPRPMNKEDKEKNSLGITDPDLVMYKQTSVQSIGDCTLLSKYTKMCNLQRKFLSLPGGCFLGGSYPPFYPN